MLVVWRPELSEVLWSAWLAGAVVAGGGCRVGVVSGVALVVARAAAGVVPGVARAAAGRLVEAPKLAAKMVSLTRTAPTIRTTLPIPTVPLIRKTPITHATPSLAPAD